MPSPYVQDLFAAMNADMRIDLQVLYMEQVAPDTYWGEQQMPAYAKVLPGRWIGFSGARIHVNPTIRKELDERDADLVIVVGYVGITNQLAIRHLTKHSRPWAFWGEVPGLHKRGGLGTWLRRVAQKPLRHAAGIAGVGSHAVAAYQTLLQQFSARTRVVHNIPYHCDIRPYRAAALTRQPSPTIRFPYCGQLIHRKGVDLLCEAFARLIADGASAHLTLAGEGPLRESLANSLSEEAVRHVTFRGFMRVADLPPVFAENDVFILPSRHDGWGVVVNQAIASGMPIIVTRAVGAGNDLVADGKNGFLIESDSSDSVYFAMKSFVDSPTTVQKFGECSAERADAISLEAAVNDWCDFFQQCLNAEAKD
jgi:glycosyltransferase involved in cell wall biosynthesis